MKIDWAGQCFGDLALPKFLVAPLPKFMIEKCGYEEFKVEKSGVEMSGVEMSGLKSLGVICPGL